MCVLELYTYFLKAGTGRQNFLSIIITFQAVKPFSVVGFDYIFRAEGSSVSLSLSGWSFFLHNKIQSLQPHWWLCCACMLGTKYMLTCWCLNGYCVKILIIWVKCPPHAWTMKLEEKPPKLFSFIIWAPWMIWHNIMPIYPEDRYTLCWDIGVSIDVKQNVDLQLVIDEKSITKVTGVHLLGTIYVYTKCNYKTENGL